MGLSQRQKGKRGERELAKYLTSLGFASARTVQHCGNAGDSDVKIEDYPEVFIECKYGYDCALWSKQVSDWITLAVEQAKGDPVLIFYRPTRGNWCCLYYDTSNEIWSATWGYDGIVKVVAATTGAVQTKRLNWQP